MIITEYVKGLAYRYETSDKFDAMWNSLSNKSRQVIAANSMWFIDFGNRTPEEVNRFFEHEWRDDDD